MTLRTILLALCLAVATTTLTHSADPPAPSAKTFALTAPQAIDYKAGKLVRVEATGATTPADVVWEVIAVPPCELDQEARGSLLLLGMPPPGTVVHVIAAATVGGKAAVAKTTVTVKGEPLAVGGTGPAGKANRPVVGRVRYLTFVGDGQHLARSSELQRAAADRGVKVVAISWEDARKVDGFGDFGEDEPYMVFQAVDGDVMPRGTTFPIPLDGADPVGAVLVTLDKINSLGGK